MATPAPAEQAHVYVAAVAVAFRSAAAAAAFAAVSAAAAQGLQEKPIAIETKAVKVTDGELAMMLIASLQPRSGAN